MMSDCKYNKIKLLHELSSIVWFIDKCGMEDAEQSGDSDCVELFKTIKKDFDLHIKNLETAITK